ncbi:MAG: IMP dehydrogenase, partial [Bdellovibrionaceae bacterium]|nr:IMP dehydrogenase [Pseudobdellovibrionaceae bacterium]
MALMFNWKDIKERDHGLTFDDVLIIPRKSEVKSRRDPSLRTKLTKTKSIETPVISANMDTVTEAKMAIA